MPVLLLLWLLPLLMLLLLLLLLLAVLLLPLWLFCFASFVLAQAKKNPTEGARQAVAVASSELFKVSQQWDGFEDGFLVVVLHAE